MNQITKKKLSDGREYSVRHNRSRYFYPKEWLETMKHIRPYQEITFKFMINTGVRINEGREVQVKDIDFENKRMLIRWQKVKAKKKEKHPVPRPIRISTQFTRWLKGYVKRNNLAPGDKLGFLSTSAANVCLKKAVKKAGIEDYLMFSSHNIRKTFENWLLALTRNEMTVLRHVGHSKDVALSSYVSPDMFSHEEKKMIRKILGDIYEER